MYRILRNVNLNSQVNNYTIFEEIKNMPYFQDIVQKCNGDCNKVSEFIDCNIIPTLNDGFIVLVDKKGYSTLFNKKEC